MMRTFLVFTYLTFLNCGFVLAQNLNAGIPIFEEAVRRGQVLGEVSNSYSFQIRPIRLFPKDTSHTFSSIENFYSKEISGKNSLRKIRFSSLPLVMSNAINTKRPYGWGNKGLLPNVGFQTYISTGFFAKFHFLEVQFQPEYVYVQNLPFQGFGEEYPRGVVSARFFYWNNGDNPERFGDDPISRFWWGQSSAMLVFGPISAGISTENIWWGPGQFNSLTFSANAEGFPHLTLKTNRPIRTPIGKFEAQILSGKLENSLLAPTQNEIQNDRYFRKFDGDWRYLNGIHISYNPVFLPNLFVGFNRTFQQYNKYREKTFNGYFPIFEVFQKETLFQNGNSVAYDSRGQDQQVSMSFRYLIPKAKMEVYGEMGRRDHAFNWRDFFLNPEHARAYLVGIQKLFSLPSEGEFIQIRGEITHQQESINRYVRYPGLIGNQTWHTHGLARGFVNRGEALGVGAGVGSNVQTLELSKVRGLNKRGILLERLANNQDFYSRAFGQNPERNPWIDLSIGILWDEQWNRVILSGKLQFIKAFNYQWQVEPESRPDFPVGSNVGSIYSQLNLVYRFNKQ
ncbi:capsule assembly Wzi family protein [Algoriphagus sp. PAP.12]|uniref:capsule assembly Wzi family protein n=1 Tax=Algoriphagus sp. PAP.12 TaxID=2996678 RepID=UPI00227A9272|nr:capsule assembly Wzi family protein [Algoriphagus sp. PAP.12]